MSTRQTLAILLLPLLLCCGCSSPALIQMEGRINSFEGRIEKMEGRINSLEGRVEKLEKQMTDFNKPKILPVLNN